MINWDRVIELRDEIGADDFQEVVDLFLDEVEATLAGLQEATAVSEVESILHFLKGSALNLGFSGLAALCQAGESAAAQGDVSQVDREEVLRLYTASKSEFIAQLTDRLAA